MFVRKLLCFSAFFLSEGPGKRTIVGVYVLCPRGGDDAFCVCVERGFLVVRCVYAPPAPPPVPLLGSDKYILVSKLSGQFDVVRPTEALNYCGRPE